MTVGYRSRTKARESLGYRTKKRMERKTHRRRRRIFFVLACLMVLGISAVVWGGGYSHLVSERIADTTRRTFTPPKEQKKVTLLIIGAQDKEGKKLAKGLAVVLFDPKENKISGLSIPENTFVEIPGHGFERIAEALTLGAQTTVNTVNNFLGLKIDDHMEIDYRIFKEVIEKGDLEKVFDKAQETSLSPAEMTRLSGEIRKVDPVDVNIVPLPVKPITVGTETYYEAKRDEVAHLVKVFWGVEKIRGEEAVRVIVLNGCGVPGVAGKVAEKLIDKGYKVVDTKNADSFDYEKTQIIMYTGDRTAAGEIKNLLEVGVLVNREMEQDVADIGVVVGKDLKITK